MPSEADGDPPVTEEAESEHLSIDDLSVLTGVPSRTIRFYQSKGLLEPPRRNGRKAIYTSEHADRLGLIAELQDRGLRLSAVKEVLERVDGGEFSVPEWLGIEAELNQPWAEDSPRIVTDAELREMIGRRRPGFVAELLRSHVIGREHPHSFLIRSPALFELALRLDDAGIDISVVTESEEIIRSHFRRAAKELTHYYFDRAGRGFGNSTSPEEIGRALSELRPAALQAVAIIFAQEVERSLAKMVATGALNRTFETILSRDSSEAAGRARRGGTRGNQHRAVRKRPRRKTSRPHRHRA